MSAADLESHDYCSYSLACIRHDVTSYRQLYHTYILMASLWFKYSFEFVLPFSVRLRRLVSIVGIFD